MGPEPRQRLARVVALLADHGLGPDDYVVIGGTAAQLAGWDGFTYDIDVVPRLADETLGRFAEALNAAAARIREDADDERGYPVEVSAELYRLLAGQRAARLRAVEEGLPAEAGEGGPGRRSDEEAGGGSGSVR